MSKILNPKDAAGSGSTIKVGRGVFLGLASLTVGWAALRQAGVKVTPPAVSGLSGLLNQTVNGGFTIYNIAGSVPAFDPSTYRLTVNGLVDEPREYTFADLTAMTPVEETRYYQCVTGWVVPRPRWKGVRLWDIVQASRPKLNASALRFTCMDDAYSESLTLGQAKVRDVLLAYGLDGKPLLPEQGWPLRLVVPGMYGYKFAKWVNNITVTDHVIPGYWEDNGYNVNAYIGRSNGY